MVKAIVFDCFGVLVTEAWLPFKQKYFGDNKELYEQASDIAKQANHGLISHDQFIEEAAKLAGISAQEAHYFISQNVPDTDLFAYVDKLKQHYKIGFLSNIAGNYLERMFSDQQLQLFDVIELSFESGYVKPHMRAFTNMAKRLEVQIGEVVLIDDQERNITGAIEAGMQAILYTDVDQLKAQLQTLLEV